MNSGEDIKIERAKRALAVLRVKVERVMRIAPGLMGIGRLEYLPKEKVKIVEDQLWDIFAYGEYYVAKVMSDISKPVIFVKDKGNFDFYAKDYKRVVGKTKELLDLSAAPTRKEIELFWTSVFTNPKIPVLKNEIDWYMDSYEEAASRKSFCETIRSRAKINQENDEQIVKHYPGQAPYPGHKDRSLEIDEELKKTTFDRAAGYLDYVADAMTQDWEDWSRFEDAVDLSYFNEVISKPYFKPYEWTANEEELSKIVVTEDVKRIPTHIQKRIHEIHHSFIFGNWLSAIALSRCLLEYALIHRKSLLEKRAKKKIEIKNEKGQIKRISELAEAAAQVFPGLGASMETVIDYGNYVMHPFRRTIPGKNHAKRCVDEITKIISALYSN